MQWGGVKGACGGGSGGAYVPGACGGGVRIWQTAFKELLAGLLVGRRGEK